MQLPSPILFDDGFPLLLEVLLCIMAASTTTNQTQKKTLDPVANQLGGAEGMLARPVCTGSTAAEGNLMCPDFSCTFSCRSSLNHASADATWLHNHGRCLLELGALSSSLTSRSCHGVAARQPARHFEIQAELAAGTQIFCPQSH